MQQHFLDSISNHCTHSEMKKKKLSAKTKLLTGHYQQVKKLGKNKIKDKTRLHCVTLC